MIRLVNGPEVVPVYVGVELCGREVRVPEHFLHGAQVGASLEQVRGERVAQRVGRDALRQPREPGGALDDGPGPDARQGRRSEERRVGKEGRSRGAAYLENKKENDSETGVQSATRTGRVARQRKQRHE